ncbi:unnamed protein product, partial [Rotaria magnacalcarata]
MFEMLIDLLDNFGSPIPSPSVSQQPPTSNEIDSPTIENQ